VSVTPSWILAGAAAIVSIWACVKTPVEESVFLRLGRWWVSRPGVSHWLPNNERDVLDGIVEKRLSDGECDRTAKQTDKATRAEKGVSLQRKHLSCLTCDWLSKSGDDGHLWARYWRLEGYETGLERLARTGAGEQLVANDLAEARIGGERAEQADADRPQREADHQVYAVLARKADAEATAITDKDRKGISRLHRLRVEKAGGAWRGALREEGEDRLGDDETKEKDARANGWDAKDDPAVHHRRGQEGRRW
jgi:hypothetical protein